MTELGTETTAMGSRTGLHRIHRATGPLGQALADLPDWAAAMTRWQRLAQLALPDVHGTTEAAVANAVDQALANPDTDVDTVLTAAVQAAAREQAVTLVQRALERVRDTVRNDLDTAVFANEPALFGHLHRQLREVVDEAANLYDELGSVNSAEAAIEANLVGEWKELPDLASRHAAIRLAQSNLWIRVNGPDIRLNELAVGFMRSPHEADPEFFARRAGRTVATETGSRPPKAPPWPEDLRGADGLRFLARHPEVEAWVPTRTQLEEREAELTQLARANANAPEPTSLAVGSSRQAGSIR